MYRSINRPGISTGAYPERTEPGGGFLDRTWNHINRIVGRGTNANPWRVGSLVDEVAVHHERIRDLSDEGLSTEASQLKMQLRENHVPDDSISRTFALVREIAGRTIGERHYDCQLIGGWMLLHGMVAEMETGEGKTLTATLAASTMALAGIPVHVITVNDYLAKRDAEWMGSIYQALGLSVGVIVGGMEIEARQRAYACDIVYCTNKEIVFDYLRDRISLGGKKSRLHLLLENLQGGWNRAERLLLRGLHYAIVDEADSVLVDEARTPLIISRPRSTNQEREAYEAAHEIAEKLKPGRHYRINYSYRSIDLTASGRGRLAELGRERGGIWTRQKQRNEMILQALTASHLYERDKHYLLKDEKIQIIDEYTGRAMPDRSWEHGLHQAMEAKEGCAITSENQPVARISYQRFFRRYHRLAGMTGTGKEVARELGDVYGLTVIRIPTNLPLDRSGDIIRVFPRSETKWKTVVARIRDLHRQNRPVLVGTRSVETSERLSYLLKEANLEHRVLNARQDMEEADIIGEAGKPGKITVATNMAGRGTDIRLGEGVADNGGLHVIVTELHDSRRIDRQLFGRCGRQGDPGSYEVIVSLEDELVWTYAKRLSEFFLSRYRFSSRPLPPALGSFIFRCAQFGAERKHRHLRKELLRMEIQMEKTLAFSGVAE